MRFPLVLLALLAVSCGGAGSTTGSNPDGGAATGGFSGSGGASGAGGTGGTACSACAGAVCGTVTSSCGETLFCGDCAQYETCVGGQCICAPQTCGQLGATCGKPDDGCGTPLDCGDSCVLPETCGGGATPYTCGCTPKTCAAEGANCGTIPDGCGGTLDCGTCAAPKTCGGGSVPNLCGCQPAGLEGPLSPAVAANDASIGTRSWSKLTDVLADDTKSAEVSAMIQNEISNYLVTSGFGFNVPSSATITGIKVEIKRRALSGVGLEDHAVRLLKSGTVLSTNKAVSGVWTSTETSVSYGGAGDLWGTSWSPADVNAPGFGAALAVQYKSTAGNDWPRVNTMSVTVYFDVVCN